MGRPGKLADIILVPDGQGGSTPRVRWEVIVERVRQGNYPEIAALSTGIARGTFYRWKVLGEDRIEDGRHVRARPEYREFRDALDRAEAEAEQEIVAEWRKWVPKDWRAAATYLERRGPSRWRRRDTIYGAGPAPDDPIVPARRLRLEVDEDAPGKLAELLELLSRAESEEPPA